MLLDYLIVFLVGGGICLIGQILVIRTQMTTARILVLFLLLGVVLEAFGLYQPFAEFAKSGAMIPICGFGSTLARGAIEGAATGNILGVLKGGLSATASGLAAAVFFSYIFAMIFRSRTKKTGK
ncbi:MAG: SpoVA/SpoVAEb family sporulation membrane protein [Clostridia bacterium]|nr:SpoVA/SpoVAEb family sporulation membrane protein [Clostridia bacterium]